MERWLVSKINEPLENATIEILSIDREVIYQQNMDAKTNDTLSIELPKNKPGKYIIEIILASVHLMRGKY